MSQFWLFSFILSLLAIATNGESPLVTTGRGTLRGKFEISRNGNQYETYQGIRYAQIPRRFDESEPTGIWDGVQDATEFGTSCPSFVNPTAPGGEDCLYLNVYTPKADNRKRAVLVFIHGGGFNLGTSSEFGGSYIMDEDVVLVTPNYRLGTLGFLNTGDGVVNGNMGIKDQVLALKWVQENIEFFGGDKNRVTISGNSAGAACVFHLLTSPLAQGLFHGAYATSGNPLGTWAYTENNLPTASEMGEYLNCNAQNTEDLVSCFREASLESLLQAQKSANHWVTDWFKMRPSLDVKSAQNPNPLLDEKPEERLRKGNFAKVPVMVTVTPEEGILIFSARKIDFWSPVVAGDHFFWILPEILKTPPLLKELNEDWERIAPITFGYEMDPILKHHKARVGQAILNFYFDGGPITVENGLNLTNLYSDIFFIYPNERMVLILGAHNPLYLGLFAHDRTDFSPIQFLGFRENVEGVSHTEDLSYVFNPTGAVSSMPFLAEFTVESDIEFSKKFINILANFVKTGVPTISFGKQTKWSPVTKAEIESNTLHYFNLDHDVFYHQKNPFQERMTFWDNLYKEVQTTARNEEL